ncbi:MAG: SH3 domain-containing protein [Romboutsia sp.]|nr:SH3 domain-containing protein [Romboutsia sp.]
MIKKSMLSMGVGIVSVALLTNTLEVNANTEGIVNTSSLNVRSGPGVTNPILFKLSKNSKVTILDTKQNWYKISYNNKKGWVNGSYINIQTNGTTSSKETKKVATTNVNMRAGAGTNYQILITVLKGQTVNVVSSSNGWDKVTYNGKTGYISNKYLKAITTSSGSSDNDNNNDNTSQITTPYRVVTNTLNIRSGASTSKSILGKVYKNNIVNVVSITNGWAKITYSNSYAYCSSQYLQRVTTSTDSSQTDKNLKFEYKLDNNKDSFIVTSTKKLTYNSFYLSNPSRLVIDIKDVQIPNSILDQNIDKTYIKTYRASYNKESNTTRLVLEFSEVFDKDDIKINQNNNVIQVLFDKEVTSSEPSPIINKLNFSYKLDNNKDSFIITSTDKVSFETSYLSNPSKLVINLKDTQISNDTLEEVLNKTYIEKYNASYDKESNTTKLEIQFLEVFDKDDIKINQNNNVIQILFDKEIVSSEPSIPSEPSNPSESINKLEFEYKLDDNKDSFIIKSTQKVSYNSFYLLPTQTTNTRLVIDFDNSKIDENILNTNINKTYIKTYRAHYYEDTNVTRLVIEFASDFNKDNIKISQDNNTMKILFDKDISSSPSNKPSLSDPSWSTTYINRTFENFATAQSSRYSVISSNGKFVPATAAQVYAYANPNEGSLSDRNYKFQFLRLDKYREVDLDKLNNYLNNLSIPSGKKNIFANKGEAFLNAAKKYQIDPLYFLSHTILETGYGTSALAQGYEVELDENGNAKTYHYEDKDGNLVYKDGKPVMYVKLKDDTTLPGTPTVTVYNLFGIGAIDIASTEGGTTKAYENGWTSVEKAIEGGAEWLSTNYINSIRYTHQNTLYSMRWDYINDWHQYSTDVGWALKISKNINTLSYMYSNGDDELSFIYPQYK